MIIYLTSCTTQTLEFHPRWDKSWEQLDSLMLLCWATVEMWGVLGGTFCCKGNLFFLSILNTELCEWEPCAYSANALLWS